MVSSIFYKSSSLVMLTALISIFIRYNNGLKLSPKQLILFSSVNSKKIFYSSNTIENNVCEHSSSGNSNSPLFKFGLIADIQYADAVDGTNFQKTRVRRYKQSLDIFKTAVKYWSTEVGDVAFSLVLGDILDGKTATLGIQPQCADEILSISKSIDLPFKFCFGNHCHYSFSREEIYTKFCPKDADCSPEKLFYDWSPFDFWRFIALDSYDISMIGASSEENKDKALNMIKSNNPNDIGASGTWFHDLPFHKKRWVPYNGAVGPSQMNWLKDVLAKSKIDKEKVIIFCHQPIYSPSKPQSLIWNAEEILATIQESGNVVAWFAGHDHDGQYAIDSSGIHHIVPCAPIECGEGENSFGHIEVFEDKLVVAWKGKTPKNSVLPWPETLNIKYFP